MVAARDLEDEGSDAHADQLGERQHSERAKPVAMAQHPEPEQLQREQHNRGNDEHEQRGVRRQVLDGGRDARLEPLPRHP